MNHRQRAISKKKSDWAQIGEKRGECDEGRARGKGNVRWVRYFFGDFGWEECLIRRYNFLDIIINKIMSTGKLAIVLCALLAIALTGTTPSNPLPQYYSDYRTGSVIKKGLTFQATVWPQ